MSPTMQSRTGPSSAPTSRTVDIVNRRPTCRPMPANATSRSTGGTTKPSGSRRPTTPARSIGPSSDPAGSRVSRATRMPAGARIADRTQPSTSPNVPTPSSGVPAWWPGNTIAMSTGVATTTTSTRRYCMNATSRSSALSSPAMPTMPDAPPATMPSAAVGRSRLVHRASTMPQSRLSPSVARLTSATATHASAAASSASDCR